MSENFIFQSYIKDISLCDDVIEYFKISKNTRPGLTGNGVNKEVKDSTDLIVPIERAFSDIVIRNYLDQLQEVCTQYINKYPMSNVYYPWAIVENISIQHYKPGQGYHGWHTERVGANNYTALRHLVFMTYLNDVNDGGETHFYHQELKVQPRKGLTLIWPADWTYTHRGIASPTEDKYIVTGWYSYHTK
jgi:hypothetical protein